MYRADNPLAPNYNAFLYEEMITLFE